MSWSVLLHELSFRSKREIEAKFKQVEELNKKFISLDGKEYSYLDAENQRQEIIKKYPKAKVGFNYLGKEIKKLDRQIEKQRVRIQKVDEWRKENEYNYS